MFKLYSRGAIALIALVPMAAFADTTVTLNSGTSVSVDQGTTNISGSGDITWTGTTLTFVGSATGADLMSAAMEEYSMLTSFSQVEQFALVVGGLSNAAITPGTGDLLIVQT